MSVLVFLQTGDCCRLLGDFFFGSFCAARFDSGVTERVGACWMRMMGGSVLEAPPNHDKVSFKI